MTEQAPHDEYPQDPVSQEHADHAGTDHEFATQALPFSEYPLLQEDDSADMVTRPQAQVAVALIEPYVMGLETVTEAPSDNHRTA